MPYPRPDLPQPSGMTPSRLYPEGQPNFTLSLHFQRKTDLSLLSVYS